MEHLLASEQEVHHYLSVLHNTLPVEQKMTLVSALRTPENLAKIRDHWKDNTRLLAHILEELGSHEN